MCLQRCGRPFAPVASKTHTTKKAVPVLFVLSFFVFHPCVGCIFIPLPPPSMCFVPCQFVAGPMEHMPLPLRGMIVGPCLPSAHLAVYRYLVCTFRPLLCILLFPVLCVAALVLALRAGCDATARHHIGREAPAGGRVCACSGASRDGC